MERISYKFGGKEFGAEEIVFVRRMAIGLEVITDYWTYYHGERKALLLLKSRGLCTEHSNGKQGKFEVLTYRATPLLLELRDIQNAKTLTFEEMSKKLCRDVSPSAVRSRIRKHWLAPKNGHVYPDKDKVTMALAVEFLGPGITEVPAVEPDEVPLFSSRRLTDWYVGEFCKLNHLRPSF
jgi:hypothetical protein